MSQQYRLKRVTTHHRKPEADDKTPDDFDVCGIYDAKGEELTPGDTRVGFELNFDGGHDMPPCVLNSLGIGLLVIELAECSITLIVPLSGIVPPRCIGKKVRGQTCRDREAALQDHRNAPASLMVPVSETIVNPLNPS